VEAQSMSNPTIIEIVSGTTDISSPTVYDKDGNPVDVTRINLTPDEPTAESIVQLHVEDNGDGSHTLKIEGSDDKVFRITGITIEEEL
jgi:hypothetical protein